uniref:Uncharacterized protein n=2 Tax=Oryza TaxID=4527 RepID=A0A0E0N6X4_ORYRU
MVAPFLLSCSVFQLARQVQLHVHGPMLNSEGFYEGIFREMERICVCVFAMVGPYSSYGWQKLASAACAWLTVFVLINDAKARESNADGGVDVLIIHDDGKRFETVGILRFKKGGGVVCRMAEAFNFGNDGFFERARNHQNSGDDYDDNQA